MNIPCKMERIANISSLYRGQRPHKFEEKMLTFQALAWDNEDQNINGNDEDDNSDVEDYEYGLDEYNGSDNENNTANPVKKKYKDKHTNIRIIRIIPARIATQSVAGGRMATNKYKIQ